MYEKITEGQLKFFDEKLSKITTTYSLEPGQYTLITDIVEVMKTLIQERNNHSQTYITVKISRRTQKFLILLANDSSGAAFCSTDFGHLSGTFVGNQFGVLMIRKRSSRTRICLRHYSYLFADDLQRSSRVQHCWRRKNFLATMLSLYLKAKAKRHYNNWTVHELSDIQ